MATEKLQITIGSDNVVRDLGFPEAEAQNLLLRSEMVMPRKQLLARDAKD